MTQVLHVIDAACDETQLQVLDLLRMRRDTGDYRPAVCSIDGPMAARASCYWGETVMRAERRGTIASWAPQLPGATQQTKTRLLHTWGIQAARACSSQLPDLPLALTLLDPQAARNAARWLRSFPTDAPVVVASQSMRARLLTAGLIPERIVVIRGPADFTAINKAQRLIPRGSVSGDAKPVLLMPGPPSESGGQFYGIWAAAVLKQVHRDLRVVMPYDSRESRRLHRFAESTRIPGLVTVPDSRLTWPELLACADVFVVPAVDDICTEPIAMAMAVGAVVVGSAVPSVSELITSGRNGLLCKAGDARTLAGLVLQAIEDDDLRRRLTDTAKADAYEVASLRAFRDNYARLYDNILSGRAPGDGIRDTAMVA